MHPTTPLILNTFSIVARDHASGMFGVATSTRLPAVGVLVPYVRAGVGAISNQARTNPLLGYDGLDLLQRGYDAQETLKILLGSDPEPEKRQVGIVDSRGGSAVHTGAEADPWRGHVAGDGYAVTGTWSLGRKSSWRWRQPSRHPKERACQNAWYGRWKRGRRQAGIKGESRAPR